jgi:hypothetical protein
MRLLRPEWSVMAKSEQAQTGDRTRGLSGTQTLSRTSPRCVSGPSLCTQGAQTSGLPLWSERGLNDDEDRQHFVGSVLVCRRPEFVQHGCTNNMGVLCGPSA